MRRELGWGQHRMVSIGFLKLCLSPRVAMDRSQKLINPFVSETKESAWICIIVIIDITKSVQQYYIQKYYDIYVYIAYFFFIEPTQSAGAVE